MKSRLVSPPLCHMQVCKSLRFSGTSVPQGYEQAFQRALWTFLHQTVYCPAACACVPLRPFPPGGLLSSSQVSIAHGPGQQADAAGADAEEDSLAYLGRLLDDTTARDVATGVALPLPSIRGHVEQVAHAG